ncbi:uncharacterized protein LOC126323269 [Schistocerca gregaria]|uniref:uncharacterized protein LOC126323269 n=1 Tax=Schistocerca gregaria TaxID=7010 RepID=UPI00211E2CA8|nr:uncharacterized protein LOC126323269 [Schistocerca gregaria]
MAASSFFVGRTSILRRQALPARAKDRKKPNVTAVERKADVSDAPRGIGMPRLVYFWNRFGRKEGEPLETLDLPWKPGEEPSWLDQICEPYETIIEPTKQLDPGVIGARRYKKAINRKNIKEKNESLKLKLWHVLPKNRKQSPP